MAAELRILDACPYCGQDVLIRLAAQTPAGPAGVTVPVIVDPAAASLHAVDPTADHPCPGAASTAKENA